jgi:anti-anti-sigma regulatory factor
MANSFVEIQNGKAIVHIDGSAVIDTAVQLHQTFSEALDSHLSIILDINNVSDCDSSFVQLIGSFCYSLNSGGRTLEFSRNTLPEPIFKAIKAIGFHFRCKCTRIDNVECPFTMAVNNPEQKQESLQ